MIQPRRLSLGAVLSLLLTLAAAEARAQFAAGNVDKDGVEVPKFALPTGAASIGDGGEAALTIPLAVPPGVRGMAPKPSLRYSSGGADDGLGKGWSLDLGFPDTIRRVTRFGMPAYGDPGSTTDVFSFGGQDLVPVGGDRYKTRIDSFQRIEWTGGYWVVREKNGTRLEYGVTAAEQSSVSRDPLPGGTYAWHLSKLVDTFGNTVWFGYSDEEDARRLTSISYGVSPGSAQQVSLVWGCRPDPRRAASYGAMIVRDQRLDRIETWSNGSLVRQYQLAYSNPTTCPLPQGSSPSKTLLSSVTESAADGTALPPWSFTYQVGPRGWRLSDEITPKPTLAVFTTTWNGSSAADRGLRLADVNGDGFPDLVQSDGVFGQWVRLHNGTEWNDDAEQPGWLPPYRFVTYSQSAPPKDLGVNVLDVSGDGLPDFVQATQSDANGVPSVRMQINNGHGWEQSTTWSMPGNVVGTQFPYLVAQNGSGSYNPGGTRFADVNGDSLPDLVYANHDELYQNTALVYLNNGVRGWDAPQAGNASQEWTGALRELLNRCGDACYFGGRDFFAAASRFVDINADGLPDLIVAKLDSTGTTYNFTLQVWLNNGHGWDDPGVWSFPTPFVEETSLGAGRDFGVQIVDMDGDGYPDVVVQVEPQDPRVGDPGFPGFDRLANGIYRNNGSNGFDRVDGWTLPVPLVYSRVANLGNAWLDAGTRLVDLDGDGATDVVMAHHYAVSDPVKQTYLAEPDNPLEAPIAALLKAYTTPLDAYSEFKYGQVSGRNTLDGTVTPGQMPFTQTVAISLSQDPMQGDPTVETTHTYAGGYYAPLRCGDGGCRSGREFRGFRRVETLFATGPAGRVERLFHQDEARKGLLESESRWESSGNTEQMYSKHEWAYSTTDTAPYLTLLTSETVSESPGSGPAAFRQTEYTSYDGYGNVKTVRERDWTQLGSDPGPIQRRTNTTYVYNDAAYVVDTPLLVLRYEGDGTSLISMEQFCYDSVPNAGCGSAPTKGAVTTRKLGDPRLLGKTLASGFWYTVTTYQYDAYGNQTVETNGRGYNTTTDWSGNGYLLPYSVTRDNPGGKTMRTISLYDKGLGVLTQTAGLNNEITRYGHDGLGRLTSIKHPDNLSTDAVSVSYFPDPTACTPSNVPCMRVEEHLDLSGNGRVRVRHEYFNGLGQPKLKVVADGSGTRFIGSERTDHDGRGRPSRVSQPFSCTSDSFWSCMAPADSYTTYEYRHDKLSKTTNPDGSSSSDSDAIDSGGTAIRMAIDHTDEDGVVTRRTYDAFSQLVGVETDRNHPSSTTHTTTSYAYDAVGGLNRTTDPRGLVTDHLYDARGLLRGLNAPDGTQTPRNGFKIWNDYDAVGNQTYHWSGPDVWQAAYDALDRRTSLMVSHNGDRFRQESLYRYDEDPTIPAETRPLGKASVSSDETSADVGGKPRSYTTGRLTSVVSQGVPTLPQPESRLSYDVRGRVVKEELLNFDRLATGLPSSLAVEYRYDREGRLTAIKDPRPDLGGRWISYGRNALGQIADPANQQAMTYNIPGYSNAEVAMPASLLVPLRNIVYDPAGRATSISFGNAVTDGYEYDWRGRVTRISGNGPLQGAYEYLSPENGPGLDLSHASESVAGRGVDVDYAYDALHRLTGASGVTGGPGFAFTCDSRTLSIAQGESGATACAAPPLNGFASAVSFRCANLPPGVSCSYEPPYSPPPAQTTLTLSVSSGAPPGTYTFQAQASDGSRTRSLSMTLTLKSPPTFTLTCSALPPVLPPVTASSTCSVQSVEGFSGQVNLGCAGLPAGVGCQGVSVWLPPYGTEHAVIDLTVPAGTPAQTAAYPFQIRGSSGSTTQTFNMALSVVAHFRADCLTSVLTIAPGGRANTGCDVALAFAPFSTTTVFMSCSPEPGRCSFNPQTVVIQPDPGYVSTSLEVQAGTTPGDYPFEVRANGNGELWVIPMTLRVTSGASKVIVPRRPRLAADPTRAALRRRGGKGAARSGSDPLVARADLSGSASGPSVGGGIVPEATDASPSSLDLHYSYDSSSNIVTVIGQGAPSMRYQVSPSSNHLLSVTMGGATLPVGYDQHGNLVSVGLQSANEPQSSTKEAIGLGSSGSLNAIYNYDGLGRLGSYTSGSASGQIIYDGQGRKLRRSLPSGGTEVYIYTSTGQVLATYKTDAGWTTYLLADGRRVGLIDSADQISSFHTDRLGSARAITSSARQVTWNGDYLPFGSQINSAAGGDNFRFTGQELDANLGLYDYGARYYDPNLRRFLQIDSYLGTPRTPQTLNRYSYALNNPTNVLDPTGHCGEPSAFIGPTLPCASIPTSFTEASPSATAVNAASQQDRGTPDTTVRRIEPAIRQTPSDLGLLIHPQDAAINEGVGAVMSLPSNLTYVGVLAATNDTTAARVASGAVALGQMLLMAKGAGSVAAAERQPTLVLGKLRDLDNYTFFPGEIRLNLAKMGSEAANLRQNLFHVDAHVEAGFQIKTISTERTGFFARELDHLGR